MDHDLIEVLADRIAAARQERRTLTPFTDELGLDLEDAYEIQQVIQRRREADGQRRVGHKLGYTSAAMREQMGVHTMNHGPLTDAMLVESGGRVGDGVLQPRVEPEIALVFAVDLADPHGVDDVMTAVAEVRACLEVVDSVWTDYRFRIEDNTADGSSASHVVLGPAIDAKDLAALPVVLERNGEVVAHATGAEACGHPAAGVVWLAGQLAVRGERVKAGELVITGGLTRAVPLAENDEIRAVFGEDVTVGVRR